MAYEGLRNVDLSGGIGGLFAGFANQDAMEQGRLQNYLSQLQGMQKGSEFERYSADTPNYLRGSEGESRVKEQAGMLAKLMSDPDSLAALRGGELGKAQSAQAKGQVDMGLAQTKIDTGKAEGLETQRLLNMSNTLRQLEGVLNTAGGPLSEHNWQQAVASLDNSDPLKEAMSQLPPQARKDAIKQIKERIEAVKRQLLSTPDAQKALAIGKQTGDWHIRVAEINAAAKSAGDKLAKALEEGRDIRTFVNNARQALGNSMAVTRSILEDASNKSGPFSREGFLTKYASQRQRTPAAIESNSQSKAAFETAFEKFISEEKDRYQKKQDELQKVYYKSSAILIERDKKKREQMMQDLRQALDSGVPTESTTNTSPLGSPSNPIKLN